MLSYKQSRFLPRRFRLVLASFLQRPGLPFADVLSEEAVQTTFAEEGACFANDEDTIYTPALTLWAFLSQVLFKGEPRSCIAAVSRVAVLLVALQRKPCSSNTGAYCRARGKLSETVLRRLVVDVADGCERQADEKWLWRDRHVYWVDGTTVSMPDTSENQAVYPQPPQQEKGLGFPIARAVVLFSLATGMLMDMAIGPYEGKETGEPALLRQRLDRFEPGAILLADRFYCSYFMIALRMELGVDFVTRVHQHRTVDFRRGRRLGKGDHIVAWRRPQKPTWMNADSAESAGDVRADAPLDRASRNRGACEPARLPHRVVGRGDHIDRRRSISPGRDRRVVSSSLAGGVGPPRDQGHDGHGHPARPTPAIPTGIDRHGSQGNVDVSSGV